MKIHQITKLIFFVQNQKSLHEISPIKVQQFYFVHGIFTNIPAKLKKL